MYHLSTASGAMFSHIHVTLLSVQNRVHLVLKAKKETMEPRVMRYVCRINELTYVFLLLAIITGISRHERWSRIWWWWRTNRRSSNSLSFPLSHPFKLSTFLFWPNFWTCLTINLCHNIVSVCMSQGFDGRTGVPGPKGIQGQKASVLLRKLRVIIFFFWPN